MTGGRPQEGRSPQVRTLHLLEGARAATGLVAVIDVFRAFTLAPCAMAQGAACILPVATPEEALALKYADPALLLAGERADFAGVRAALRHDPCGAKFFDPARPWFPPEDFDVCMRASEYPFVLRRARDAAGRLRLERVDLPAGCATGSRGAIV